MFSNKGALYSGKMYTMKQRTSSHCVLRALFKPNRFIYLNIVNDWNRTQLIENALWGESGPGLAG